MVKMKNKPLKLGKESIKKEDFNEEIYPEYYRQAVENFELLTVVMQLQFRILPSDPVSNEKI